MSEWKELKIEDFCEVIGGGTPSTKEDSYYGGDISWITPRDLTNYKNRFISRGERNITDLGLKNSSAKILPKNSILLTSRAPIGYLAIAENEVCTNQGFKSLIVDAAKADYNFVYYLIKSNVERIKGLGTGTTFAEISGSVVKGLKFTIPDLPTQTAIAEILSSLDDKIELNNKINQELENLAQTLFKQWFIDFEFPNENGEPYKSSGGEMVESELGEIPKGWDKIKLADLVTKSHTGADAITRAPIVDYDTGIKCARVGDMTNKRSFHNWAFCKIKPEDYKRQKLEIGDIIVTRTATLGINQIIRENIEAVCNNGLIRLQIDKSICDPMFIYVQFQGDVFEEWISRISGDSSTRPNMQMEYLLDFKVIIPEKELMRVFTESIKAYYDLIDENNRVTELLITTRDTLLPKLISGELEVSQTQTTS
ncbi:MAG: restriction endonuclease subunit S [Chitinophagaceae bacterium]|nr:restriction endonuclease subunit S [Chitinophagaceae bacterium]